MELLMPFSVTDICSAAISRLIRLPLFQARISAGFPSPAEDYIDKKLDLNDYLIRHPSATFFVRVEGCSMQDAGINDGDLLIVDRAAESSDKRIVIAVINGEMTVKRIKKIKDKMYLLPENDNFRPMEISEDADFQVWGVVTHVIHSYK
jgi:DNA polymerase V